jgi:galactokinase
MPREVLNAANFDLPEMRIFQEEAARHPLFEAAQPILIARAPGRLDLMGGIADYSGSLVLQWPLSEATMVAAQSCRDGQLQVVSLGQAGPATHRSCVRSVAELFPGGVPLGYAAARKLLSENLQDAWSAYALGILVVLAHERGAAPPPGLRMLIRSNVPEGKGVSSSAALEVASAKAVSAAFGIDLAPRELALLAQTVENRVVGAACGVMDQMTSSCGAAFQLLALLCQPAELRGTLPVPEEFEIWGIDSGLRHAVSGADYTSVRVGAFMGARILAERAGLRAVPTATSGLVRIDDQRWNGYLANITPSELDGGALETLPETLRGSDFLDTYGGITDPVTRVETDREYAVRACAAHPIREHFRVRAFAELLQAPPSARRSVLLGELMYQSHASYSACGLGSNETDLLVTLTREAGASQGFYGAKITGGGSGGTVAVLGRRGADVSEIARAFETRTGHRPQVFSGSSAGAGAFGAIRLGPS